MKSEKIRILYCMETIASGGVEQRRLLLSQWFDKEKFEIKIICTNSVGYIAKQLNDLGVEIITVGSFSHSFHVGKYREVIRVIKQYKPHIIHGAVFEGMSMAAIGGVFGDVPIRLIEETSDPQTRSGKAVLLQKIFSIFSDKVIAISPSVLKYLIDRTKVSKDKAILINNGVRLPSPSNDLSLAQLKLSLGIKEGDFIIGTIGRLFDGVKRFSDLISAMSLLKIKRAKLLLVGEGPDLEKLKSQAISLGLNDQFIAVGYIENPYPIYEIMDIFCLPSAHEGFGLVAAEAMLHSLPVVATRVGGLKDIVVDGETGFLVPPYSPELLAEKLELLIQNPEMCKIFGGNGYQRALENYTSERYCREVEKLYFDLLREKGLIS